MAALTERLEQGRSAFNRQEYFEAHELWEEAWRQLEGAERILVQGLIQIAAGLHHLQQHRPRPAAALLRKGLEKTARGAVAVPADLRVGDLSREIERWLSELEAPGTQGAAPSLPKL